MHKYNLSDDGKIYLKMVKDKCLYSSINLRNLRSCNAYARLSDKRYIQIIGFIVDSASKDLTICNFIEVKTHKYAKFMKKVIKINSSESCVYTENIKNICVFLKVNNSSYLCPLPNLLHY